MRANDPSSRRWRVSGNGVGGICLEDLPGAGRKKEQTTRRYKCSLAQFADLAITVTNNCELVYINSSLVRLS
jgi:hypothetical protein